MPLRLKGFGPQLPRETLSARVLQAARAALPPHRSSRMCSQSEDCPHPTPNVNFERPAPIAVAIKL